MPLMKRTVRLDSGAWSLLKKAAVRASATARSFASTVKPKFPVAVAGAFGLRKTAKTRPARSTTAMTIVSGSAASAPACTTFWTSVIVKAGGGPGTAEGGVTVPLPQPVIARRNKAPTTSGAAHPSASIARSRAHAAPAWRGAHWDEWRYIGSLCRSYHTPLNHSMLSRGLRIESVNAFRGDEVRCQNGSVERQQRGKLVARHL